MNRTNQKNTRAKSMDISVSRIEESMSYKSKGRWIQHYADQVFRGWLKWRTFLGVSHDYLKQIRNDMATAYEDSLSRLFIEGSYKRMNSNKEKGDSMFA